MSEASTLARTDFSQSVLQGLSQPQKAIPSRFFYDLRGSQLFEEITALPEYYPTRTEVALLQSHAADLGWLAGHGRPIIEFGAGSAMKTPLILDATHADIYVPIDISAEFLGQSVADLARRHPSLQILPVTGDFSVPLDLPPMTGPLTGFFPGSTLGNFDPYSAINLLRSFRQTLGEDAQLIIGLDTRKNPRLLEAAYNDAAGVTAAFNLNLLERINRELSGTIPVNLFEHSAIWHDGYGRIEMHLVALTDLSFEAAGERFTMSSGETIHTENSYKYTLAEARLMARASGWEPMKYWTDADEMFGVHVWAAAGGANQA